MNCVRSLLGAVALTSIFGPGALAQIPSEICAEHRPDPKISGKPAAEVTRKQASEIVSGVEIYRNCLKDVEESGINSDHYRLYLCSAAAGDPSDPKFWPKGLLPQGISEEAIELCLAAIEIKFLEPRYHYQLARALAAYGYDDEALVALEPALEEGYPAAAFLLAELLFDGGRNPNDRLEELLAAAEYYEFASLSGYPVSVEKEDRVWRTIYSQHFINDSYTFPLVMQQLVSREISKSDNNGLKDPFFVDALIVLYLNFQELCNAEPIVESPVFRALLNVKLDRNGLLLKSFDALAIDAQRRDFNSMASSFVRGYEADPVLFVSRHGCDTPVARRLFANLKLAHKYIMNNETALLWTRDRMLLQMKRVPFRGDYQQ